jgi:hypothetical protein
VLGWLRMLTLDAWNDLLRANPPDPEPAPAETYKVLGLYLVVGLVLWFNRFFSWESFDLIGLEPAEYPKYWNRIWWASAVSFAYFVPPALYVKLVLRERLRDYGFSLDGLRSHLPLYLFFFGLVLPFVVLLSGTDHFLRAYPLAKAAGATWTMLIVWELVYALQFITLEFFFRGFMIFGPRRTLGAWVVPMMAVPYLMLHFQKPGLEALGSIIAGMALGMVALHTRSIYAGMVIHIAVAWSMDLLALTHKGELARLLGP